MGYGLLEFIMIVPNVLFDDRFPDRFHHIAEEMKGQGIENYNLCSPIYASSVVESINLSQKKIVRDAMERGDKEICLIEDDIMFTAPDSWEVFLKNKPKDYDVYISGSYLTDNRNEYKPPLVKVNEWVGNHCIIINHTYFQTFLNLPFNQHIDTANRGLGDFYVCFPFVALQRAGFSSNNGAVCDYNQSIPKEYIYKG